MSSRVCVIDMPGLSRSLLSHVPSNSALGQWIGQRQIAGLTPTFPAVTCSVQASLTTGRPPAEHGIIANGLPTFRFPQDQQFVDASNFASFRKQISFWEQSNQFLDVPRFWTGKYKTALLFFQNSMPGFVEPLKPAADIVLTPKPDHSPDGKLISLCWSEPRDLVPKLFAQFGPFPLMNYWGPMSNIASSKWIAKASAWIWEQLTPRLQWVYIPHLDYDCQRFGPSSPAAAQAVLNAATALEPLVAAVQQSGGKIVLLSEYAFRDVSECVSPNRLLTEAGLLVTRDAPEGKLIDYERSSAIAMADHQIAHVYLRDESARNRVRDVFLSQPHLTVADRLPHRRSGDLILRAAPQAWLDYRWWTSPSDAPSFAKMVDIHRKPGYDPLELFWDRPTNGTSQDSALIRGSHGLVDEGEAVLIGDDIAAATVGAQAVAREIQNLLD
jgi:predicted AlkP superfamily pyrophosphatase or phosphodiesterase